MHFVHLQSKRRPLPCCEISLLNEQTRGRIIFDEQLKRANKKAMSVSMSPTTAAAPEDLARLAEQKAAVLAAKKSETEAMQKFWATTGRSLLAYTIFRSPVVCSRIVTEAPTSSLCAPNTVPRFREIHHSNNPL